MGIFAIGARKVKFVVPIPECIGGIRPLTVRSTSIPCTGTSDGSKRSCCKTIWVNAFCLSFCGWRSDCRSAYFPCICSNAHVGIQILFHCVVSRRYHCHGTLEVLVPPCLDFRIRFGAHLSQEVVPWEKSFGAPWKSPGVVRNCRILEPSSRRIMIIPNFQSGPEIMSGPDIGLVYQRPVFLPIIGDVFGDFLFVQFVRS